MKVPELTKTQAIILLMILVAIGGIVLYGPPDAPHLPANTSSTKQ